MPGDDPLVAAVQRAATELPSGQLHKLADTIAKHGQLSALARHGIVNAVPTAVFRHHATAICKAWMRRAAYPVRRDFDVWSDCLQDWRGVPR